MGVIHEYRCPCGFQAKLWLGTGINGIRKQTAEEYFPGVLEKYKPVGFVLTERMAAVCSEEKKLVSVPKAKFMLEDGKEMELLGACPECGSKVTLVENPHQLPCPHCGKPMDYLETGRWD